MAPFFVGSKGGKCAAFSFPTPIPTFPEGEGLVASCRSSESACGSGGILLFGRRWILGHVLGALLRTAAGWRLTAGYRSRVIWYSDQLSFSLRRREPCGPSLTISILVPVLRANTPACS